MSRKMYYFLLALIVLALIWGFFIEPHFIVVERIKLDLEENFDKDLKILHLSDFHSTGFGRNERKAIEIVNEVNPDIIFITGDFVDTETKDLESCSEFWRNLNENYNGKIFGVSGNHEHWHAASKEILNLLEKNSIELLDNESVKIELGDTKFNLIGVEDPYVGESDIEKAMKGTDEKLPSILLAHSPEIFRKAKKKDIDLILTGHTHGGQIDLPFITKLILPLKHSKQYKEGLFKENSTFLYVNKGIGTTILPARFNSPPEATVISFK